MAAGAMDYCYENPRMCFYMVICLGLFVKKEKLQRKLEMVIRNMFHQVANIMAVVHGVKEIV